MDHMLYMIIGHLAVSALLLLGNTPTFVTNVPWGGHIATYNQVAWGISLVVCIFMLRKLKNKFPFKMKNNKVVPQKTA